MPFNSCLGNEITSLKNDISDIKATLTANGLSASTNHASGISTNNGLISTNAADIAAVELEKGQKGASVTGAKGDAGTDGNHGLKGASGTGGQNGEKGASGTKGDAGTDGNHGSKGASGTDGQNGEKGASGTKGDAGASAPIPNCADVTPGAVCVTCSNGFTGDGTAACDPINPPILNCADVTPGAVCGTCANGYTGDGTAACTAQTLSWVSDTGNIVDGNKFYADGSVDGYEGAAINHVFMGDFDILIKSTGNGHQGMGMTYGPAVATADPNDYCTFVGAYNADISRTGYGCKAWATASSTAFTGGYDWPEATHATFHSGQRVVYTRFTRVGNVLTQKYFRGGADEWLTGRSPSDITNLVTSYATGGTFTTSSSSGVMITIGEASSCHQISGGPAGCPFILCATGQTC